MCICLTFRRKATKIILKLVKALKKPRNFSLGETLAMSYNTAVLDIFIALFISQIILTFLCVI